MHKHTISLNIIVGELLAAPAFLNNSINLRTPMFDVRLLCRYGGSGKPPPYGDRSLFLQLSAEESSGGLNMLCAKTGLKGGEIPCSDGGNTTCNVPA